jgi:hypothetical protein
MDQKQCLETLRELIKSGEVPKSKLNEFLKIQSDITMHKLAYALFRNDLSRESFRLEKEIIRLTKLREDQSDPGFLKAKELFEKNPLSRTALFEILPFIEDILKDQIGEESDLRKQYLNFGMNEIKMLAILAEKERKFSNGLYDHRLFTVHSHPNSILNFAKVINASMRKDTGQSNKEIKESMFRRLQDLREDLSTLLGSLGLGDDCEVFTSSCLIENSDKQINENFLSIMNDVVDELDDFDKHNGLRYNDLWLKMKYKRKKRAADNRGTLSSNTSQSSSSYRSTKAKTTSTTGVRYVYKGSKPLSDKEVIDHFLADRVVGRLSYFVSKDELLKDKELLYALADAIDRGGLTSPSGSESYFVYKGNKFAIPETWNKDKCLSPFGGCKTNRSIDYISGVFEEMWFGSYEKPISFKVPDTIKSSLKDDFITAAKIALLHSKQKYTFVFDNKIYDIYSGKEIQNSKLSLFKFVLESPTSSESVKPFQGKSQEQIRLIANEVRSGHKSYVHNGKVFTISSVELSEDKMYSTGKSIYQRGNVDLELGIKVDFPQKDLIDIALSKSGIDPIIHYKSLYDGVRAYEADTDSGPIIVDTYVLNHNNYGYVELESEYIVDGRERAKKVASLNGRERYSYQGETYFTDTNRRVASDSFDASKEGMLDTDLINDEILKLNKLESIETIKGFHEKFGPHKCDYYTVIDKQRALLTVFSNTGDIKLQYSALIGMKKGDERTRYYRTDSYPLITNLTSSAGVFSFGSQEPKGTFLHENHNGMYYPLNLADGSSRYTPLALHSIPKDSADFATAFYSPDPNFRRVTNGGIGLLDGDMQNYLKNYGRKGCPFYILPEEDNIEIAIENSKLVLRNTDGSAIRSKEYEVSKPIKELPRKISIEIKDDRYKSQTTFLYTYTLEKEKANIMQVLGLTNQEYDELAKLSFGILGIESQFGVSSSYTSKEEGWGQSRVTLLKKIAKTWEEGISCCSLVELDGSDANSRGLTQIKSVRSFLKDHYPEITSDTLNNPEHAAIATMFVLAEKSRTMDNLQGKSTGVNESNRNEFLYYVYSGSAGKIRSRYATPDINQSVQKVLAYMDSISIMTE